MDTLKSKEYYSCMVDWVVGSFYTTLLFTTNVYVAIFPNDPRVCCDSCETVVQAENVVFNQDQ